MNDNNYFLHLFKDSASLDTIQYFYEKHSVNIDINTYSLTQDTPLIIAAKNNQDEHLKWLVENGANVNHQNKNMGFTALMMAILVDAQKSIDYLLDKSDLSLVSLLKDDYLSIAISEGSVETLEKLINFGIQFDKEDETYYKKPLTIIFHQHQNQLKCLNI